jgi:hypothetical protein
MLSRSTYAKLTHHHLLAVCALAIGAVAAVPNDADVEDDASSEADASTTTDGAAADAAADVTTGTTTDATVSAAPEGGSQDAGAPGASDSGAAGDAEEGDASQYITPDGAPPPYDAGDIFGLLCVANPNESTFVYSSVPAPYTDTAGCMAYQVSGQAGYAASRTCLCQNCYALEQQCDSIEGCREIQTCALKTGCNNVDSCYLVSGDCATVINAWGNGSVATGLSEEIMNCAADAGCQL